jgi:DNA (cytosine-5)-methyltransferase 1
MMRARFAVVDLFAGPGGFAEGFSRVTAEDGGRPFKVSLSVERNAAAHSTLLLRSFLRQFPDEFPREYYSFLNRECEEPNWSSLYPKEWRAGENEALKLELGSVVAEKVLAPRLDALRTYHSGDTVLIGGPPCQAYSLVGRSRNRGVAGYVAEDDPKHYLYKEYVRILRRLKPLAFVMENVKGLLSAAVGGQNVLEQVFEDVRSVRHQGGYQLVALTPKHVTRIDSLREIPKPQDFIVRANPKTSLFAPRTSGSHRVGTA